MESNDEENKNINKIIFKEESKISYDVEIKVRLIFII